MNRRWLFFPLLLGALGVPYAVFDGGLGKLGGELSKKFSGSAPAAAPVVSPPPPEATHVVNADGSVTPAPPRAPAPRLEGPPVREMSDVIRFDITPRWVAQYWSQVSTVTAELELEGLRVPLVTGGKSDDIAGSLTYYFDKQHQLQRLTFYGTTGDERRLVYLLTSVYKFQEQPSLGGGMFVITWNGKPTSVLRVSHAPVLRATAVNTQREIALEINRPSERYGLSQEMQQVVNYDAHVRRW